MTDKLAFRIIAAITIAVPALVLILHLIPKGDVPPKAVEHCPLLNACLNGTCFLLLIASYIAIRNKKVSIHRALNITAFTLSAIFLLSYVAYHAFHQETLYPDNSMRPVYMFILWSHIVLSAIVLPMVLLTFYRGLTNQVIKHRKLARWTMPIWLYVTLTGVIVYLMISPYYQF